MLRILVAAFLLTALFAVTSSGPVDFPFYVPRTEKRAINPFVDTIGKRMIPHAYPRNRQTFISLEDMDRLGRYTPRRMRHLGFTDVEGESELWQE